MSYRTRYWLILLALTALCAAGCRPGKPANALIEEGTRLLAAGEPGKAADCLRKAVRQQPANGSAWCNLGIASWKLHRTREAAEAFRAAADLAPRDPRPMEFLAALEAENGHWKEAEDAWAEANRRFPGSPRILTGQATAHLHTRHADAATNDLTRVLALAPNYAPALFNMAIIQRDWLKNHDAANSHFQRFLKAAATNDARTAEARRTLGLPEPTATVHAAGKAPVPTSAALTAARSAIAREKYDEAVVILQQAAAQSPADTDLAWELAVLHQKHLNDTEATAQAFREFARRFPSDPRAAQARGYAGKSVPSVGPPPPRRTGSRVAVEAYNQGVQFQQERKWKEAIAQYSAAIQSDPGMVNAYYNLGLVCRSAGDAAGARKAFAGALEADPTLVNSLYMLALVCRDLNQNDEAIKHLEEALRQSPDFAEAHLALGLLLKSDSGRKADTRQHFTRYLELNPGGPAARDVRSWLDHNR